jgi:NADH-quinone oxidoreductase subunit A
MHTLGVLAFLDLLVFFGVLLVGFAYLWKRGDLEWVRSVAAQVKINAPQSPPVATGGLAETR